MDCQPDVLRRCHVFEDSAIYPAEPPGCMGRYGSTIKASADVRVQVVMISRCQGSILKRNELPIYPTEIVKQICISLRSALELSLAF